MMLAGMIRETAIITGIFKPGSGLIQLYRYKFEVVVRREYGLLYLGRHE